MTLRPIIPSLVNDLAPPQLRGRYNAANAAGFQPAGVIAPPIAGFLIASGRALIDIALVLGAALALSAFAVRFFEPRVPLRANGVRRPAPCPAERRASEVAA